MKYHIVDVRHGKVLKTCDTEVEADQYAEAEIESGAEHQLFCIFSHTTEASYARYVANKRYDYDFVKKSVRTAVAHRQADRTF